MAATPAPAPGIAPGPEIAPATGIAGSAGFVYLNGRFIDKGAATLSVEDRGTLFGDGVYEVIRYYAGRPLALDAHLGRLRRSLGGIRLAPPADVERLPQITADLLARNGLAEAKVYWQITRGAAPREFVVPRDARPSVLVIAYPAKPVDLVAPAPRLRAVLADDERWHNCWIKSLMLLSNSLTHTAAVDAGADAAILHRDGRVTEATSANAFAVRGGVLYTHPADRWILHGVTRAIVLELAASLGIAVREEAITTEELRSADEVFLTGTTTHVSAVTSVDGARIGNGDVGPITRRLHEALMARIARDCLAARAGAAA